MVESEDVLSAVAINQALSHTRLGGHVQHFASVGSTNEPALAAARAGQAVGAWIADEQTAGRGRGGHTWHSAPGEGLYVTGLWTPRLAANASQLSLVAGLAAWESIREVAGLTVDLRWPNDLVTRGPSPARKLGGILAETATQVGSPARPGHSAQPALLRYAVIGIGINVAHQGFPPGLQDQASSLRMLGWGNPSRQRLVTTLLENLDLHIRELEKEDGDKGRGVSSGPGVLARLPEASTWIEGKRVRVGEDGGYTGVTAGLDAHGFLRVRDDAGSLRTVRSGGVREA